MEKDQFEPDFESVVTHSPGAHLEKCRSEWSTRSLATHHERYLRLFHYISERPGGWDSVRRRKTYRLVDSSASECVVLVRNIDGNALAHVESESLKKQKISCSLNDANCRLISAAINLIINNQLQPDRDDTLVEKFTSQFKCLLSQLELEERIQKLLQWSRLILECEPFIRSHLASVSPPVYKIVFTILTSGQSLPLINDDLHDHRLKATKESLVHLTEAVQRNIRTIIQHSEMNHVDSSKMNYSMICSLIESMTQYASDTTDPDSVGWLFDWETDDGVDVHSFVFRQLTRSTSFYVRQAAIQWLANVTFPIIFRNDAANTEIGSRAQRVLSLVIKSSSSNMDCSHAIASFVEVATDDELTRICKSKFSSDLNKELISALESKRYAVNVTPMISLVGSVARIEAWSQRSASSQRMILREFLREKFLVRLYINYLSKVAQLRHLESAALSHECMNEWVHLALFCIVAGCNSSDDQVRMLKDELSAFISPSRRLFIVHQLDGDRNLIIWCFKKFMENSSWLHEEGVESFASKLIRSLDLFITGYNQEEPSRKTVAMAFKLLQTLAINRLPCFGTCLGRLVVKLVDRLATGKHDLWLRDTLQLVNMYLISSTFGESQEETSVTNEFAMPLSRLFVNLSVECSTDRSDDLSQTLDSIGILFECSSLSSLPLQYADEVVRQFSAFWPQEYLGSPFWKEDESVELSSLRTWHAINRYTGRSIKEEVEFLSSRLDDLRNSSSLRRLATSLLADHLVNRKKRSLNDDSVNRILSSFALAAMTDIDKDIVLTSYQLIRLHIGDSFSSESEALFGQLCETLVLDACYATWLKSHSIDTETLSQVVETVRYLQKCTISQFTSKDAFECYLRSIKRPNLRNGPSERSETSLEHRLAPEMAVEQFLSSDDGSGEGEDHATIYRLPKRTDCNGDEGRVPPPTCAEPHELAAFLWDTRFELDVETRQESSDRLMELVKDIIAVEISCDYKTGAMQNSMDCY